MPKYDVPRDVLMNNGYDMQRRPRRFHHEALDDGDADRTESRFVAEAKTDMGGPFSDHGSVRHQGYLRRVGDRVVPGQFANARPVDLLDGRQHVQIDRPPKTF